MSRDISIKMLLLSAFSIIFTSFSTAQVTEVAGSWSLFGDLGQTLLSTGNAVIWYEISTLPDLAFFIAIWVATAAITLKFIDLIWSVITQRINLGSGSKYSVSHDSDGAGTLEKIVAIALSFIGAQYIGMIIGPLLAGTMLLLGSMIVITVALIFYWFVLAGKDSLGRSGSSGGGSGGFSVDVDIGGETDKAEEDIAEGEKEESEADSESKDAESKEEAGDEETADREARSAAEHLQNALKDFAEAEGDIKSILDKDLEEMNRTLNELQENMNVIEEEEELIQTFAKFPGQMKSRLVDIRDKVRAGDMSAFDDVSERDLMWLGYGDEGPSLVDLNEEGQNLRNLLQNLKDEVMQEREIEGEEEKELAVEVKELMVAHELIQRLQKDVELARHVDDDELDVLAEQIGDEKLHEMVGYEEEEEEELLNDLQSLVAEEEKIEEYLETADQILAKMMQLDREEIQEIRSEEGSLSDALTQFREYEAEITDALGSETMITLPEDGTEIQVGMFLGSVEHLLEKLEADLDDVLDAKSGNEEEVEEIRSYVEEAIKEVSS